LVIYKRLVKSNEEMKILIKLKLFKLMTPMIFHIVFVSRTMAKFYNRPKYSFTHYTLRIVLLNGCTDSYRRVIRRVVGGNRPFLHLQCAENRAVSSQNQN